MYITKSEVEQYTGITIDSGLDGFITTLIEYATEYIEKYTGRVFEAPDPDSDVTRYYNGNGATKLSIDDLRELTTLSVDSVELDIDDDFQVFPLNYEADGVPITRIDLIQPETRINSNSRVVSTSPYVFEVAQKSVVITGKWGYSATPPKAIKVAALRLVGAVIKENIGDNDIKEITSESIGEYSVSFAKISEAAFNTRISDVLDQYVRKQNKGNGSAAGTILI